jgi:hypothetical protein
MQELDILEVEVVSGGCEPSVGDWVTSWFTGKVCNFHNVQMA